MDGIYLLLTDPLNTLQIVPTLTVLLVQTPIDIINHSDAAWAQINSINSGFLQLILQQSKIWCKTSCKMLQCMNAMTYWCLLGSVFLTLLFCTELSLVAGLQRVIHNYKFENYSEHDFTSSKSFSASSAATERLWKTEILTFWAPALLCKWEVVVVKLD